MPLGNRQWPHWAAAGRRSLYEYRKRFAWAGHGVPEGVELLAYLLA